MPAPLTPFVASMRGVLSRIRRDVVQALGLRPTLVTIRTRTWSEGEINMGTSSDSDLALSPTPKVEVMSATEVKVGPIVPPFPGGGYTVAQLNPLASIGTGASGVEVIYVLDGPNGTYNYTLERIDTRRAFRYMLHLKLRSREQPV